MSDKRIVKAENDKSGTLTAQLSVAEVTTAYVSPVPTQAPGVIVFEPDTSKEEHVFYKERDAVAGTISGLSRDITNLNGGTGQLHANGEDWEILQSAEYVNNIVDVLQEGWQQEMQTVAYVGATSFTVRGNQTGRYSFGRLVRYNESDSKIGMVVSSSYNAGTGLTTVTVRGFSVPNPLTMVEFLTAQAKGFASAMPIFYAEDAEVTDTYVVTLTPNIGAYYIGMLILVKVTTANTDAATLNVNGLGAVALKKWKDQALITGDIKAGQTILVMHDGTNFQILSHLAQTTDVQLIEAPGADLGSTGIKETLTAGEDLVFGDVCYFKSDGKMWKADADAIATSSAIGMALGTIATSATGQFLLLGVVRNDAWAWTVGGLVYLSTTTGALTQTAPSGTDDVIQILGVATHADRMLFHPQLVQVEHA